MEPKSCPSLLATISIWSFLAPTLCDTVENHVQSLKQLQSEELKQAMIQHLPFFFRAVVSTFSWLTCGVLCTVTVGLRVNAASPPGTSPVGFRLMQHAAVERGMGNLQAYPAK